jgi:hypothetical protein
MPLRLCLLSLIVGQLAFALELEIRFPILERNLSKELFTQDGKRYVKGTPQSKCNFAYLANPQFGSRDGKLWIRAKFTGRSSLDVFGKCVGFGDSFDFEVLSNLTTKDGTLLLADPTVKVLKAKDSYYSRQVEKALQRSIGDAVKYPIREEIRKLLAAASAASPYRVTIGKVEIRQMTILKDSLLLDVDTRFVVE